ncbi:MAG: hypothetical protein E3J30_08950 [Anaerolineales bacterium]|nr:MAG: hypothetical protein E3J30_08950 [Anaerolineales bacterium]
MTLWLGPLLARLFGPEFGPFFQYLGVLIGILVFFVQKEVKFHQITGYRWFILHGVIYWVGFEMIRATFIPMIATTAFIGYTQATQPWVIQPVSIFSVYGLNLVIMLFNFALAQAAITWFNRKSGTVAVAQVDGRATRNWLVVTGVVVAAWISLSLVMLNGAPEDAPTVRVAALTPNFPLPAFQDEVNTAQMRFDVFAEQAREAAQQGAQILYTPEMLFDFDPQVEFTDKFRALAEETGAYIFLTYTVENGGEDWRNEAVLLTPAGEFLDVYGKNHVFGEPPTPTAGVFPVYNTPLGNLATLICHDANYTDIARKLARNGAQIIGAPYREFGGFGEQAWTNVLFRAVENRSAMVITGVATVTGIIDPYGRLVALDLNPDGARVTLVRDVSLGSADTPFLFLGDWLGWIAMVAFAGFMVFQVVVERRAKKAT